MVHRAVIKDSPWHIYVGGFRVKPIEDVEDLIKGVAEAASPYIAQLLDADRVAGWEQLYLAAVNAIKAFQSGYNIARNLAVEILLYASCQDQIAEAIELVGVSKRTNKVALVLLADDREGGERAYWKASRFLEEDDSVLEIDEEKLERLMELHSISEGELEAIGGERARAITMLLVERGALIPALR